MEKIEVGDVFTFDEGNVEYVCDGTGDGGQIHANGRWFGRGRCHLVRKAIPQPDLPKTWQFRREPYVAPVPKTLADVPEGVDVVAANSRFRDSLLYVMRQRGGVAFFSTMAGENRSNDPAWMFTFLRYLDQPPAKPLSLDDVPDGRVIQCDELSNHYWQANGGWWVWCGTGSIGWRATPSQNFKVTDLIAEFR